MHTKGIMEYYTPAIGDPLHVVLPYVCWQRFRPIEKIGDIERYRAANVAAAFVFENDAIEYCAAHNGAVSPAQLEKVGRNGGAQWVRSLIDAAPETGN